MIRAVVTQTDSLHWLELAEFKSLLGPFSLCACLNNKFSMIRQLQAHTIQLALSRIYTWKKLTTLTPKETETHLSLFSTLFPLVLKKVFYCLYEEYSIYDELQDFLRLFWGT